MYELKKHYCDCHPATCNCDPWSIEKDGEPFIPVYFKDRGELIVKALNYYELKREE